MNSNFPNRWSPASLTFNNYFTCSYVEFLKIIWCSYSQNIPLSLFLSGDVFTLWPSSAPVNGKTMKLLNDLDIASDGTIYMSDSSTKWDRRHNRYCIMEADNSGRYCILSWKFSLTLSTNIWKRRKENPQKLTQLSSRSHPRHLVGKRAAQKDTIVDITSDNQVNSNFPYRWSPASLTFNNYFYLIYIYI